MSIIFNRPAIAAAILGLTASAAFAETTGRFTLSPVEDGFVRLDKETGAMALCSKKEQAAGWSCTPMDDIQQSLGQENERLQAEIDKLKAENRRLEDTFVGGGRNRNDGRPQAHLEDQWPPGGMPPGMKLPSEEDVDKAIDYLEGMIRKFRDRFNDFGEKTDPRHVPRDDRGWRDDPPEHDDPSRRDNRGGGGDPRGSTPL